GQPVRQCAGGGDRRSGRRHRHQRPGRVGRRSGAVAAPREGNGRAAALMDAPFRNALIGLSLLLRAHSAFAAEDAVTAASQKNFGEYLELLAIENVADKPEDMRRNAAFL